MEASAILTSTPSPTVVRIPPPTASQAVIPFIRSAYSFLTTLLSFFSLSHLLIYLASLLLRPILFVALLPVPVIRYVLSPISTFYHILVDLLIRTPIRVALYILDELYPIYVFLGVACITGCLLGWIAKWVSNWAVGVLVGGPPGGKGGHNERVVAGVGSAASVETSDATERLMLVPEDTM